MTDLIISGNTTNKPAGGTQIDVWCSRWDRDKWTYTLEFWCTSSQREKLWKSVTPGAVEELYNILGVPSFYDATFSSGNTLTLTPKAGTTLAGMRSGCSIGVSDYREEIVAHTPYYHITLSGRIV